MSAKLFSELKLVTDNLLSISADLLDSAINMARHEHSQTMLTVGNTDLLSKGVYHLDRVVNKRKKQIRHFDKPVICITINLKRFQGYYIRQCLPTCR